MFQLTIQYMLWDKFKILDNYNVKQLANLAKFLTHLFIQRSLSISILKVMLNTNVPAFIFDTYLY